MENGLTPRYPYTAAASCGLPVGVLLLIVLSRRPGAEFQILHRISRIKKTPPVPARRKIKGSCYSPDVSVDPVPRSPVL
jgi:hypothetical protein